MEVHVFDGLFDWSSLSESLDLLIKLGIGAVLAALIGWERERSGHVAGVRTHMLVIIGVILFAEAGKAMGGEESRVAAQVVTGIGFLGAGAILRHGAEIIGLTTAASIWATAGIGMCVSVAGSFLLVAACATVLILITLAVIEKLDPGHGRHRECASQGSTADSK